MIIINLETLITYGDYLKATKLEGHKDVYKIKLKSSGYRLAYQVENNELIIIVIAIGKREKGLIYKKMNDRLS